MYVITSYCGHLTLFLLAVARPMRSHHPTSETSPPPELGTTDPVWVSVVAGLTPRPVDWTNRPGVWFSVKSVVLRRVR